MQVEGLTLACTLRGALKRRSGPGDAAERGATGAPPTLSPPRKPLSVGDRVRLIPGTDGSGVIHEVLPRHSHFTRVGFRGRELTIVSNVDLLVIVFACAEPRMDPWKLDRFLVAAEAEQIDTVIVANKTDLVRGGGDAGFDEFRRVGYTVVRTSALSGEGMDDLRGRLQNRIAAFVGPSGAGKSSLLNALHPSLHRRTGQVSGRYGRGRHTTTGAELLALAMGGWVADTPGLQRLELAPLPDDRVLIECFPEFRDVHGRCRFRDCRHSSEPQCAVRALVDAGQAARRRYESYLALHAESAARRR